MTTPTAERAAIIADTVLTLNPNLTLRSQLILAASHGIGEGRAAAIELVAADVRAGLESDSNDDEHDALFAVADAFEIEYRSPYDDDEDEDES